MLTTTSPDVHFQIADGVRIRCADSGGSREPRFLLTSPWPESLYAFAPIWATLAELARLFAIDLPGSAHLTAATTSCLRKRWVSSWPRSLDERLPNSRVVVIDGGHFIWEEAPAEYAAIILDSISGRGS
jgi:pimeloyl-ACP methyl ester carboxylesterase